MLVDIVQDGLFPCLKLLEELVLTFLVPVYYIVIELDKSHEPSVPFHDKGLADIFHIVDDILYFLRIYILSGRSENHVVETALDIIPALVVDRRKVIGPEPAVISEYGTRPLRVLVIAKHHIVAFRHNLTFACLRIDIDELDGHAVCGNSRRARFSILHSRIADERGSLGKAIADGIREFGFLEELFHMSVKL